MYALFFSSICYLYALMMLFFPAAYLTASIGFLNSTIHDQGPET